MPSRLSAKKTAPQAAPLPPDPIQRFWQAETLFNEAGQQPSFFRKRLSQFAGLSAVLAFMLVDLFADTSLHSAVVTDWKLVALFLPMLLIPIALTLTREPPARLTQYAFIGLFVTGMAVAGVLEVTERHASWFNQESLTLATLYIYFLSGLSLFRALFCGLSAWLAFGISQLYGLDFSSALQDSYYLFIANAVGASGLYHLEWNARQKYQEIAQLRADSLVDETTGLLNRRSIDAHLKRVWRHAWRESKSLCVLRLNTDRFHDTCRQLGKDKGTAFLLHVAQALSTHARRPLDAVGRYGNDEFLVVWYDPRASWLQPALQVLNSTFASFDAGIGLGLSPFTLSGAIARVSPQSDDEEELARFMDKICLDLRRAKQSGGGRIVISDLSDPVKRKATEQIPAARPAEASQAG
ncbi:MAG: GGDEF domain-containing protein [Pseudomonadota bacterium]